MSQLACACSWSANYQTHHDRFLQVETDTDAIVDLLELALTWGELEYDDHIGPDRWLGFVAAHSWANVHRVERIVGLALDAVRLSARPVPGARTRSLSRLSS